MLEIKIENFEGPLDLLLHLIDKNKMQIMDIKISIIADEYIALINKLDHNKLDELSEFVEMAAILLSIKSSMLLPKYDEEENDEPDEREKLIERLIEYKKFKIIGEELRDIQSIEKYLGKDPSIPEEVIKYQPDIDVFDIIKDYKFEDLIKAFNGILRRQEERIDTVRSNFSDIKREEYTVDDVKTKIMLLSKSNKRQSFFKILSDRAGRIEIIVNFLAILELIKEGYIDVVQNNDYDDIFIEFLEVKASV